MTTEELHHNPALRRRANAVQGLHPERAMQAQAIPAKAIPTTCPAPVGVRLP
jgi:hypothetical protein